MWYTNPMISELAKDSTSLLFLWAGMCYSGLVLRYLCWDRPCHPCDKSFLTRDLVYQPCDKEFWYIWRATECHTQGCGVHTRFGRDNLLVWNVKLFPILISLILVVIYTRIAIKIDEKLYLLSKLIVTISYNS